ncbi:hypothetical protein K458DRAFT_420627 [Lentithecium fluviatile CBS 122367]|uniref:Uncharacterized protein n=1 Tax=Lentithecium fluviatile CBS 122367 TaxID=1168545 RepID=A0A6G1IT89_9PLEO|nr:hypothetical protein K458DRAFT_420627 [Lentithecium fluviatile CBS 122367]
MGTQIGGQAEDLSIWTPEGHSEECPTRTEDAIKPEAIVGTGTQTSELSHRELTSTQPIGSSMMNIEQPTQEASGHTLLKAPTPAAATCV